MLGTNAKASSVARNRTLQNAPCLHSNFWKDFPVVDYNEQTLQSRSLTRFRLLLLPLQPQLYGVSKVGWNEMAA